MARSKSSKVVQIDPSVVASWLREMVVPACLELLFVDWAFERYEAWCRLNRKPVSIARAELAFPGPFLRIVANRRSFYFAWDAERASGVEIGRAHYPRAAAVDRSLSVVPTPAASKTIGAVRQSLLGRLGASETN